jgi:predicted MFS family arabinose efflux permease
MGPEGRGRVTDQVPETDGWRAWSRSPVVRAVVALGITQIIGWGTTVYALGVLAKPIVAETGWRFDLVVGGFTSGLLASALVSTTAGRLIDRRGGRHIMTVGSAAMAVALAAVALAPHPVAYLAAWAALGVAMRLSLYDAAFAALVQVTPSQGRRAISYLTLFGGFASSVFWPLGHALAGPCGWRGTFLIFAALNLVVCVPLHWFGLRQQEPHGSETPPVATASSAPPSVENAPELAGRARRLTMALFAVVMSACAFVFGALAVLLPALLEANGVSAAAAVTLAAIKGAAQVGGRFADIVYGQKLAPLNLGRIAVGLLPLSFGVLYLSGSSFGAALAFTILFGISNGLVTIVRGAVPLALFGAKGYGEILGVLATPYLILNATAPVVIAAVVDRWGFGVAQQTMFAAGLIGIVTLEVLIRMRGARSRT